MTELTRIIIIYVMIILVGRIISQRQRKCMRPLSAQTKDIINDWTALLVAISATIAISLPVFEASLNNKIDVSVYVRVFGLLLIVVGWIVAYAGNRAIAENWSPTIDTGEEQKLIVSGIYSIIRHPLYLSGILIIAGIHSYFLSSWAWLGAIVGLLAVSIRVPIEEKRLVERFGKEYVDYQKRTKAILPMIL